MVHGEAFSGFLEEVDLDFVFRTEEYEVVEFVGLVDFLGETEGTDGVATLVEDAGQVGEGVIFGETVLAVQVVFTVLLSLHI